MQEFFHNFVVNFFLFVTALKFVFFLLCSCLCRNRENIGTFSAVFPGFGAFGNSGEGGVQL